LALLAAAFAAAALVFVFELCLASAFAVGFMSDFGAASWYAFCSALLPFVLSVLGLSAAAFAFRAGAAFWPAALREVQSQYHGTQSVGLQRQE